MVRFGFLCQLLQCVRETLPRKVVFYGAGKTDLCDRRWDINFEKWKQPNPSLGRALASESPEEQYESLIFWFDDFMVNDRMHQAWDHVLDGQC